MRRGGERLSGREAGGGGGDKSQTQQSTDTQTDTKTFISSTWYCQYIRKGPGPPRLTGGIYMVLWTRRPYIIASIAPLGNRQDGAIFRKASMLDFL